MEQTMRRNRSYADIQTITPPVVEKSWWTNLMQYFGFTK